MKPKGWLVALCDVQSWRCAYCGSGMRKKPDPKHPGSAATVDHILPISRGGRNQWSNLCAACERCNAAKGAMTGEEFRAALAIEARRAETAQAGSVHESAGPQDNAQGKSL